MMKALARLVSGLVISTVLCMAAAVGPSCEYGPWVFGPCNPVTLLKYGERTLLPGSDPECAPEVTDAIDCVVTAAVNVKPVVVSPQTAPKPVVVSHQAVVKPVVVSPQSIFSSAEKNSPGQFIYLLTTPNVQTTTTKQPAKQAHCGPAGWLPRKGVRGIHYKMLALVNTGSAITKCEELCLKDNKCTSFDTITVSVATLCFGNPGPGPLVKKADFSHWEYLVNCSTASGKVFVFHYLGSYYAESNSHCIANQVSNLQECLSLCAENSSCAAGLYGEGSCCLVSNVEDVRLVKVVANGSELFEKRPASWPVKPPSGKRADSCIAIQFGSEPVYPVWKNAQICWSGKAKRECVYNYDRDLLKSSKAGNMTDQLLTKGTYEQCLLLCTEMSECYEADYLHSDSLCKINVEKAREWDEILLSTRPDTKRWSYYTKDTCFMPMPDRNATAVAAGQGLVSSTLGTLLLSLGAQSLL